MKRDAWFYSNVIVFSMLAAWIVYRCFAILGGFAGDGESVGAYVLVLGMGAAVGWVMALFDIIILRNHRVGIFSVIYDSYRRREVFLQIYRSRRVSGCAEKRRDLANS